MDSNKVGVKQGQVIDLEHEGKNFKVIVIDPNGLGRNQASVGFGYNMMEEHGGLPQSTVTDWRVTGEDGETYLKVPKGSTFRVTGVKGLDILALTSEEVATLRDADETWLGDEVRAAFEPGEQRIIFKDGELQKRWRDYSLSTNPDPKRPYEEWSDFAKAKINGYHFLDQVLKAQKSAPDHDRSGE